MVEEQALAVEEMKMTFAGEFGELLEELSPAVIVGSQIVSAIMTVAQAPWPDTPKGLFVIEVFTHPDHRRCGLARFGLVQAASQAQKLSYETMGLRVQSENAAAYALYQGLGFEIW